MNTSVLDYAVLLEAFITSAVIRFVIFFIPMKRFASYLGEQSKVSAFTIEHVIERKKIERVRLAVARTARVAPWRCLCYEQAFTAKVLLKRRKIKSTIYFGVRKNEEEKKIDAHAWLRTGPFIITGKKGMLRFKEIASFS